MAERHRVVVVGGGFAGVNLCKALKNDPRVDVTLIDRRNYHLFQPLLYQVATGALSPGDIAAPLRSILKGARNLRVLLGEVVDVDASGRQVVLRDFEGESRVPYDTLVIATGARHSYFGKPEWEALAPGLKSIEDATEIRARVLYALEAAEKEPDPEKRKAWLTMVVVGAGPTGVELSGALGELTRHTMRREFRNVDPAETRIFLVEFADRVLTPYVPQLSARAKAALEKLGVTILLGTRVADIEEDHVVLADKEGKETIVPTRTVLWAAGVEASPLGKLLAARAGAQLDRAGRVVVNADCTVDGHPEILVLGDLASYSHTSDGKPLPGVAPVAMQMGTYAGKLVKARLDGKPAAPFRYFDKGSMAVIGRNHAVVQAGRLRIAGFFAWLMWLFVHIMYLVDFENKLLVLVQWAMNYFTRHRGARLITPEDLPGRLREDARLLGDGQEARVPAGGAAAQPTVHARRDEL